MNSTKLLRFEQHNIKISWEEIKRYFILENSIFAYFGTFCNLLLIFAEKFRHSLHLCWQSQKTENFTKIKVWKISSKWRVAFVKWRVWRKNDASEKFATLSGFELGSEMVENRFVVDFWWPISRTLEWTCQKWGINRKSRKSR